MLAPIFQSSICMHLLETLKSSRLGREYSKEPNREVTSSKIWQGRPAKTVTQLLGFSGWPKDPKAAMFFNEIATIPSPASTLHVASPVVYQWRDPPEELHAAAGMASGIQSPVIRFWKIHTHIGSTWSIFILNEKRMRQPRRESNWYCLPMRPIFSPLKRWSGMSLTDNPRRQPTAYPKILAACRIGVVLNNPWNWNIYHSN